MSNTFKKLIKLSSILFLGLIIFSFIFYYEIRDLRNPNKIVVELSPTLEKKQVKVVWFAETIDSPRIIFNNGAETGVKYKEYGPNRFKVYYKDSLIGQFSHFKTNNWHGHIYTIGIQNKNETLLFSSSIQGPDRKMGYQE